MKKNREKCVLCESNKLKVLYSFKMPLFMGVNNNNSKEYIDDMTFLQCEDCEEIQIKEFIDLNILYNSNHNIGVIGETWKNHYIELAKYIEDSIKDKTVLEISDPSAKIAKLTKGFKEWVIVEPNPEEINLENVSVIKTFFDDDFKIDKKVDVIIHSHLLEHIHEPHAFFKKCHEILSDDGKMFISIPDMNVLVRNGYSPNNILHFEHTYYIDDYVLNYLANKNGFSIVRGDGYRNHSIFFELVKSDECVEFNKNKTDFIELYEHHVRYIKGLNYMTEMLQDLGKEVYIFGAHVSSQFYLYNGLNLDKINCILDNSKEKQGHKLYGSELLVKSPSILENLDNPVVICSHSGIYRSEIESQLKKINKNVVLW